VVPLPDLGCFGSIALVLDEIAGVSCSSWFGFLLVGRARRRVWRWIWLPGVWEPGRRCPTGYLGRHLVVWIGSRDHVCHSSVLILFMQVNPRDFLNCKFCNSLVHLIFDYVIRDLIVDFLSNHAFLICISLFMLPKL
jgi:hypothetical protein